MKHFSVGLLQSIGLILLFSFGAFSQRVTVGTGGVNLLQQGNSNTALQSVGQASVIGNFSSDQYVLSQGFLHPAERDNIKKEEKITLHASLYPNPVCDKLIVTFDEVILSTISIEICDLLGKVLLRQDFEAALKIEVDLSDYKTGFYFIKIESGNKKLTTKLVKGS